MSDNSILNPCPCCGGKAVFVSYHYGNSMWNSYVECRHCQTRSRGCLAESKYKAEEKAATNWNHRVDRYSGIYWKGFHNSLQCAEIEQNIAKEAIKTAIDYLEHGDIAEALSELKKANSLLNRNFEDITKTIESLLEG